MSFRRYAERPAYTGDLTFTHADIKGGKTVQSLSFPRLGAQGSEWTAYEYQVRWSIRDGATVSVPPGDKWIKGNDAAVALTPPFERRLIEVDVDRSLFEPNGVVTAVVEVGTTLGGKPRLQRKAILRASDAAATTKISVYADRASPAIVRVTWHGKTGRSEGKPEVLESDYLFLTPPDLSRPAGGGGQ